jgi:SAM-dependent methyltransferase
MRAIHRVAPSRLCEGARRPLVLDVGGGRSGLAAMLYPGADVVTVDLDAEVLGKGPPGARSVFVKADACRLPFADSAFDAVALFDVLEHVRDDGAAVGEALRVTRREGAVIASTPSNRWRYPYFTVLRRFCPSDQELMDAWGHVRRGYSADELARLFGLPPTATASFINGLTAFAHDVAFSRLSKPRRRLLHALAAPMTAAGYLLHRPDRPGAEIALAWRR